MKNKTYAASDRHGRMSFTELLASPSYLGLLSTVREKYKIHLTIIDYTLYNLCVFEKIFNDCIAQVRTVDFVTIIENS